MITRLRAPSSIRMIIMKQAAPPSTSPPASLLPSPALFLYLQGRSQRSAPVTSSCCGYWLYRLGLKVLGVPQSVDRERQGSPPTPPPLPAVCKGCGLEFEQLLSHHAVPVMQYGQNTVQSE